MHTGLLAPVFEANAHRIAGACVWGHAYWLILHFWFPPGPNGFSLYFLLWLQPVMASPSYCSYCWWQWLFGGGSVRWIGQAAAGGWGCWCYTVLWCALGLLCVWCHRLRPSVCDAPAAWDVLMWSKDFVLMRIESLFCGGGLWYKIILRSGLNTPFFICLKLSVCSATSLWSEGFPNSQDVWQFLTVLSGSLEQWVCSVQFKMVSVHLEKPIIYKYMYTTPSLRKFPQCCLWNCFSVCLTDDGPLSSFQGRLSTASSFHTSFLQWFSSVLGISVASWKVMSSIYM